MLTTELVARLRMLLSGQRLDQEVNTVKVDFDEHASATDFFDTLVEIGEPDVDAVVEDLTEFS